MGVALKFANDNKGTVKMYGDCEELQRDLFKLGELTTN